MFEEKDIDFSRLSWKQFEELCYDVLVKYNFRSLIWRQGGADKGRDIEAQYETTNSLVGLYTEKWLIECKHYDKGISVGVLAEKIEWAKAEKPDHFLVITNSYLTQSTRDWLEKLKVGWAVKVHVIEGKGLKQLLLKYPELIARYFESDQVELLKSMLRQWAFHDVLPEPKALFQIFKKVNFSHLGSAELGFLWFAQRRQQEGLEEYCRDEHVDEIDYDFIIPFLKRAVNTSYPILPPDSFQFANPPVGTSYFRDENRSFQWASVHEPFEKGKRVQVVLEVKEKIISVLVASQGQSNKKSGWI
jgi:Restriction endonuclease